MSPEQWEKVSELFQAARGRPRGEQIALLDSSLIDHSLRGVVEQMLRDDEAEFTFLDQPVLNALGAETQSDYPEGSRAGVTTGVRLGRYETVALFGRGGMGEVWMARDLELDRSVALKFLTQEASAPGATEQFTREARAASALNHPNIITIHEVIRYESQSVIVMELVEGASLRALCGPAQSLERVVDIGSQVAKALASAHAHGIVHRDIKPENIVLRQDGYVKVLDFGLARRVGSADSPAASMFSGGTLRYMSPEQARGEAISHASDVFSLGLVLYELATGEHAFPSDSMFASVCAMLVSEPALPSAVNPRISARLESLILEMLSKKVESRPSSQEVFTRLAALGEQTRATSTRVIPIWKWASGIALGILATAFLLRHQPANSPEFANLRIEPLTSQDGWESGPALSPDGKSVAFTWSPTLEMSPQLYVKREGNGVPVMITDSKLEGIIGPPVWSPDSTWIAFKRELQSSASISRVPSAGGPEEKLVDLKVKNLAHAIDWSPDGHELTFSDLVWPSTRLGIFSLNLDTRKRRQLACPDSVEFADWDPKFSPDGRTIAFKRVRGFWDDSIYTVPSSGGQARQAIVQSGGIWGHAWSRDGNSLILSCQRGSSIFGLWRFPLDRRSPPERIIQGSSDAITPATSRKSGRVVWVNQTEDVNIYRLSTAGGEPERLIASTARDRDAAVSPDGRIAFISDRSGSREIWLAGADGSSQFRVTNFNGPDVDNLAWSPDGRQLAFDARVAGRSDIFTLTCDQITQRCDPPKVTVSGMKAQSPTWSADGRFLYFASDRTGNFEIWRKPAVEGIPTRITHIGGYVAQESADGKRLYFSSRGKLYQLHLPFDPSDTSTEEVVIGAPFYVLDSGWAVTPDEIFFADRAVKGQMGSLRAFQISSRRTRVVLSSLRSFADSRDYSLTVSHDRKWLLYSQLDHSGSNAMVAESH